MSLDAINQHIGARLKTRRQELRRTQLWLGAQTGVTLQQVSKYESGSDAISASTLHKLAQALGVGVSHSYEGLT